jgi:basic membrane protein A
MKKVLLILLACMLLVPTALAETETYDLALVTDLGTIDDKSFNQGAWEGLVKYAEENGISHKYYQPIEQSDDAYLDSIALAVEGGAKLIVTPGYLFETPIFIAQDMYPDVKFVLVDGNPHSADYAEYRTEANTVGILYAEEQSGFLAGYAVVKEGYTKLGFMGGMAVPAVIRFGYGFVQGAEYAAKELGIEEITVNYHYTGGFNATPEAQALAASWYNDGAEVIFACGGQVGNSVMAAAEAAQDKWVVGVDVDQSAESERVITSSMKGLRESVYAAIEGYYNDAFPAGEAWVLTAAEDGVGLPMATSQFTTFDQAAYDAIFAKLAANEIAVLKDDAAASPVELPLEIVAVTEVQ